MAIIPAVLIHPDTLGPTIRAVAESLRECQARVAPQAVLYCEKRGGFQCRTCCYATAVNATHGRCAVMDTPIHLNDGCCVLWDADTGQLHLYREP